MNLNESMNLNLLFVPATDFVKEIYFSLFGGKRSIFPGNRFATSLIIKCASYPDRLWNIIEITLESCYSKLHLECAEPRNLEVR